MDCTERYVRLYRSRQTGAPAPLPPESTQYAYLLVPGHMSRFAPGYFTLPLKTLQSFGLEAKIAWEINTVGPVAANAAILKDLILSSSKPLVIIGHSKGAVDAAAALTLFPETQPRIRRFVSVQAPYQGSPIADLWLEVGALRVLAGFLAPLLGGQTQSVWDVTTRSRKEFTRAYPFPAEKVPTWSVASVADDVFCRFPVYRGIIRRRTGRENDGFIVPEHAVIPGSREIHLAATDHEDTVRPRGAPRAWFRRPQTEPRAFTEALIRLIFSAGEARGAE
ncbi:MAG: hypothetical protein HY611_02510 [Elusimicrobia bacterium]|nr:hypothetical protein [Elusimicrobiota bacterium]